MTNQNFNTILAEALAREKNVPTNAERIRAKTDEELAELISRHIDCEVCPIRKKDRIGFCRAKDCKEAIMEWLKEEVEE